MFKEATELVLLIKNVMSVDTSVAVTVENNSLVIVMSASVKGETFQLTAEITELQMFRYRTIERSIVKILCNSFENIIRNLPAGPPWALIAEMLINSPDVPKDKWPWKGNYLRG